jgi:leucyl aminopeptidase
MKLSVKPGASHEQFANCVVFAAENPGALGYDLPGAVKARLESRRELGDFSGKRGKTCLIYAEDGEGKTTRWLVAGLGSGDELDSRAWRVAAAAAQKALASLKVESTLVILPPGARIGEVATGLLLSGYKYGRFIKEEKDRGFHLSEAVLRPADGEDQAQAEADLKLALITADGVMKARELMNGPGNLVNPPALAETAREIAAGSEGRISTKIMGEAELAADGCRAILAVGAASVNESQLVIMEYAPKELTAKKTVAFVGKGVTFDTGGISLKPGALMDEMKFDMGGAAAVLGLFQSLAGLDLPLKVVGLVPAVENMPGGKAYRPGDIVVTRSGLSIEIKNTDAEGRVVMSDALDYAKQYEPDLLVDLATLTGACVVALAHETAGMMGNEEGQKYYEELRASGDRTGERVWPLPMYEEYDELIKSDVADMTNTGGRYGGSITAAKLLQRFADHSPWIHLDIAGTAWTGKERDITPKGGNGFGVRLLLDFLSGF